MISNKLLVANLMIGLTILFQGLVPMRHISKFEGFWMFSAGVTCMVLAVITFIGLLIMSRSRCMQTMGKIRVASGLVFVSTIGILLMALLSAPEIPSERDEAD
ncbi:hypothetical protein B9Z55_010801 [Caenorhabditis nigoni]|uniref:Uncharacterized protein n=1 Tax=Caenorhabditis nigoni TaxID=1611254 RepID=A0A2G5UHC3_9PELO|nr:hypothetical protein B9Z55_010801 [Caenorhabditis nigoni]